MSRERDHGGATKVYVGDLPPDATEREIEKEFTYYGRLKSVWVARNPPGFAFVEFEDSRDADDAIAGLDGKSICGSRVRVELSSGKKRPKPWERDGRGPPRYDDRDRGYGGRGGRGGRPGGRPFDPNDECYKCGGRGHYAYDCKEGGGGRRGGRDRSDSRDRGRWRSRSRSRSGGRDRRRSLSPRRGRSGSRD